MERKIGLTPIPRSGKERVLKLNYFRLILNYMERKIGFAPISHSGKECVLRVELLPHRKLMERKIGLAPIPRSGKERVLRVELLPHDIKMERKIGLTPISHSGKECVLKLNYSRIILEAATGFEPVIKVCRPLPYHLAMPPITGLAGFEPARDGVKVRCLTAWL